jgi:carbamoyl-phosphate synthase large subunit
MNPRIGGGYPFSHIAGANLPAALIAWASGQTPDRAWFNIRPNVAASRCDDLLVIKCKALETARPRVEQKLQRVSLKA